jgi:hypothetical protein
MITPNPMRRVWRSYRRDPFIFPMKSARFAPRIYMAQNGNVTLTARLARMEMLESKKKKELYNVCLCRNI